jgi:hypothetical protein
MRLVRRAAVLPLLLVVFVLLGTQIELGTCAPDAAQPAQQEEDVAGPVVKLALPGRMPSLVLHLHGHSQQLPGHGPMRIGLSPSASS